MISGAKKFLSLKCRHCDPVRAHPIHLMDRVDRVLFYVSRVFAPFEFLFGKFPRFWDAVVVWTTNRFFSLLLTSGLLRECGVSVCDETVSNRTLVVVKEACRRGIEIKALKFLGRRTSFFTIAFGGRKEIFEGLPGLYPGRVFSFDFDDKYLMKKVLQEHNLPCPSGEMFRSRGSALRHVQDELGFPVVVKPRSGSLSKHTTCGIRTENDLLEGIAAAKRISVDFVVERFVKGGVYRILVVYGKFAACCFRERPNVVGDGLSSISELIRRKNMDPLRGSVGQKNCTLHKIDITGRSIEVLTDNGLSLESVAALGEKVYLHDKITLASGADICDRTDDVHESNKAMFLRAAELCGSPIVGLDFVCDDISAPYFRQDCGIIEANSLPYIDMHHYPSSGKPRDVAAAILDGYLGSGG